MHSPFQIALFSRAILPTAILLLTSTLAARADVAARLGSNSASKDAATYDAVKQAGGGTIRISKRPAWFWDAATNQPTPAKFDADILLAYQHGLTPMLLLTHYTKEDGASLGDSAKWHAIGRAFAERFRPDSPWLREQGIRDWGATFYAAINEPMWKTNNTVAIDVDEYKTTLEAFADGIHQIEATLHASPGGYQEVPLFGKNGNPYLTAVAPLFNNGKLYALGIHRYWDEKYVPMRGKYDFSLQRQFEFVKRNYGITADVKFYTDEFNYKRSQAGEILPDEEIARGFLTAMWDALGVVNAEGKAASQMALVYTLHQTQAKNSQYGISESLDPWVPMARGKVFQLVTGLARGMEFTALDPKGKGEFVLEGAGKMMWVWQNRAAWTNHAGTSFKVTGWPAGATKIEVYTAAGLERTVALDGQTVCALEDLPTEQTLMFVASSQLAAG